MNVAIQPCSYKAARKHYQDTIESPVHSSRILDFLPQEQRAKFGEVCGNYVSVWGVTPGVDGRNRTKWSKLSPGDIALFYRDKLLFAQGRILLTVHNEALAVELWNREGERSHLG